MSAEDLKSVAETLKAHVKQLPPKDQTFANSLLYKFERYKGKISEKQAFWIVKLADRAQGIPDFTQEEPEKVRVGMMTGLITIFESAAKNLKYPAFTLETPSGTTVRLSRAGANSKNPGAIYVKTGFEKYVSYAGKVTPEGEFVVAGTALMGDKKDEVAELLKKMARHPAQTAAEYGQLTGKCCFCSKPLSDAKSTAAGYGKTCADHYGLPWGGKSA